MSCLPRTNHLPNPDCIPSNLIQVSGKMHDKTSRPQTRPWHLPNPALLVSILALTLWLWSLPEQRKSPPAVDYCNTSKNHSQIQLRSQSHRSVFLTGELEAFSSVIQWWIISFISWQREPVFYLGAISPELQDQCLRTIYAYTVGVYIFMLSGCCQVAVRLCSCPCFKSIQYHIPSQNSVNI